MWIILIVLLIIALPLVASVVQKRWPRLRQVGSGLLVSYFTIVLILGAGEVYFRYFQASTDGLRSRENWMARYWQVNSGGFRDREWTPDDWANKHTLLALGDSFTAGWGVENPADRFSDVLAAELGDDWAVINLGLPGSSTRSQLTTLKNYPMQTPDVVMLQYFMNDIEDAALSVGKFQEFPQSPEWIRDSYLANYLFSLTTSGFGPTYWDWEYAAYDDYGIWQIHQQEIFDMVDYVDSLNARLIVVIFPNMQDPFHSIPYVDRVEQAFRARGVTDILKLTDDVAAWKTQDVIVSPRDAHPSAAFHHYVAEKLYNLFFKSGE